MIDIRTNKDLKDIPILKEPRTYIYVLLNSQGKVKIGKTRNIYKRYKSLCGSNGQGIEITKVLCSPATFLHNIENILHDCFAVYRIKNTEWFYNHNDHSGEKLFDDVTNELKILFSSSEYEICNRLRAQKYKDDDYDN